MTAPEEHSEMLQLLQENVRLAKENNELLQKMHRWSIIGIILRVVWYTIIIGVPFVLYFYLLEPYFTTFTTQYESFRQGVSTIPSLKGLEYILPQIPVGK
jgi:hypothetical protein